MPATTTQIEQKGGGDVVTSYAANDLTLLYPTSQAQWDAVAVSR